MTGRVRWMLGVASVLAIIRFALVPWATWVGEQRGQIKQVRFEQARARSTLERSDAIRSLAGHVQEVERDVQGFLGEPVAPDVMRLRAQRTIQTTFESAGLSVESFSWIAPPEPDGRVSMLAAQLRVRGLLHDVVAGQLALLDKAPNFGVREQRVQISQTGGRRAGQVTGSLVISVLYQQAPES